MSTHSHDIEIFSPDERQLVEDIKKALRACRAKTLERTVQTCVDRLQHLASVMEDYPSLLKRQRLGGQARDSASLVEALSHTTLFTVDMILPMRAVIGQTYVMGRLNFFRLLHRVIREALTAHPDFDRFDRAIADCISRSIYARVVEALLTAIVSDETLDHSLRTKAARALTRLWESRFSTYVETYFPVLRATWEARRKITVHLGTLMGVSELFALMGEGGDPRFIDYFSRHTCTREESQAFREFLFGLSIENLEALNPAVLQGNYNPIDQMADTPRSFDPSSRDEHAATRFATRLYVFFVKRHFLAQMRRVSHIKGPKRTAEEYVMIYFLAHEK